MSDNIQVNAGSGPSISADEKNFGAGNVLVQHVALIDATDNSVNRNIVDANGDLHVKLSGLGTGIDQNQISLPSGTATKLPTIPLANRASLQIFNSSAVPIYVGGSTVTASGAKQGIPVAPGQPYALDVGPNINVYAIQASGGTVTINILELA